jgi:hypothetical protein
MSGCKWPKASRNLSHAAAAIIHSVIEYCEKPHVTLKRKAPYETTAGSREVIVLVLYFCASCERVGERVPQGSCLALPFVAPCMFQKAVSLLKDGDRVLVPDGQTCDDAVKLGTLTPRTHPPHYVLVGTSSCADSNPTMRLMQSPAASARRK